MAHTRVRSVSREVWHDAERFRMVRTVARELDREGAHVRRVVLDDEIKSRTYRAFAEARETLSERSALPTTWARDHLGTPRE